MRLLRIIGKAAVAFYEELFFYFLAGLGHIVCWLLIIPGPFALAGIYTIGQRAVRGFGVKWRLIWNGIKEFGVRSLVIFLIVLLGYAIVVSNLVFYNSPKLSPFPDTVAIWLTPLFAILGVVWSGVAFYAQSFLMELQEPTIPIVLRNSLFLTILRPFTTLGLLVLSVLILALSVVVPVFVIAAPGFLSVLSLTAVRTLITELTDQAPGLRGEDDDSELEIDEPSAGDGTVTEADLPAEPENS